MSSTLTRFEIIMPIIDTVPPAVDNSAAINTFLTGLAALTKYKTTSAYVVDANGNYTNHNIVYGNLASTQTAGGLALLTALNTALGTPVECTSWPVASQP